MTIPVRTQEQPYQQDLRTLAIYHVNETVTGVLADASDNGFDGVIGSGCTPGVTGQFDKGTETPATDTDANNIIVTDAGIVDVILPDSATRMAIEFWMAAKTAGEWGDANEYILMNFSFQFSGSSINTAQVIKRGSGDIEFIVVHKGIEHKLSASIPADVLADDTGFHQFVLSYDSLESDVRKLECWINARHFGIGTDTHVISTPTGTVDKLSFGNTFNAIFDEIRVSNWSRNPLSSRREEIIDQVQFLMEGISRANGFMSDVVTTDRNLKHINDYSPNQSPGIVLGFSNATWTPEIANQDETNDFVMRLDLIIIDDIDQTTRLDRLLADVEIALTGGKPFKDVTPFEKVSLQGLPFVTLINKQSWFTDDGMLELDGGGAWGRLHLRISYEQDVLKP